MVGGRGGGWSRSDHPSERAQISLKAFFGHVLAECASPLRASINRWRSCREPHGAQSWILHGCGRPSVHADKKKKQIKKLDSTGVEESGFLVKFSCEVVQGAASCCLGARSSPLAAPVQQVGEKATTGGRRRHSSITSLWLL